jgi:hypothetical protein
MDDVERQIYYYVKSLRPTPAPARDISRRVGSKRRFRYNPQWTNPFLERMVERGILETDADGSYRLKPIPRNHRPEDRWVAPEIAQALAASGKTFQGLILPEDEDEYYEKL